MEIIKTDTHFNFVRLMKPAVILSIAVIIIGIASLIWHGGPNYGIDFAGGTLIQIKFQNETPADKIRSAFKPIGFEGSIIQNYGPEGGHRPDGRIRSRSQGAHLARRGGVDHRLRQGGL